MLGTGNLRTILQVLLPASFPSIVAGLRIGAGLGWQSLVGAELIVASAGVGYHDGAGAEQHLHADRHGRHDRHRHRRPAHRRRPAPGRGVRAPQDEGWHERDRSSTTCGRRFERDGQSFPALEGVDLDGRRQGVRRDRRPLRLRQDHVPAHGRRVSRCRPAGRVHGRRRAGDRAGARPRRRVPAVRAVPLEERAPTTSRFGLRNKGVAAGRAAAARRRRSSS